MFIAAGVVVLLVVAGGTVLAVINGNRTAEQAVRDYVTLIAKGDGAAANNLVDPRGRDGSNVDPARIADALRSATGHITIERIDDALPVSGKADTVSVDVYYSIAGGHSSATLRVRRESGAFGVLDRWRVIDPLLVPVSFRTGVPTLDSARLGAARVPVTGPESGGYPQRPVLLYPAQYRLQGQQSKYLDSRPTHVTVASTGASTDPLRHDVTYRPSPKLRRLVLNRTKQHVRDCVSAGAAMASNCPEKLQLWSDFATNIEVTGSPRLETFAVYQTEYHADGPAEPPLHFRTESLRLTYTNSAGQDDSEGFSVIGKVSVNSGDDVDVTFESSV